MRKMILALFMVLLFAAPTQAGNTSAIFGAVKTDGAPLANVTITIIGEATYHSGSTVTDEKGVYFFTNLPSDEYIVRAIAQPSGVYKPGFHNIILKRNVEKEVNFSLKKR